MAVDYFHFISVRYSYKIVCTKAKIGHRFCIETTVM